MKAKNLKIEIDFDGKTLIIAEEGSSGCAYTVKNEREFIEYVISYVLDCVDPELKYGFELK
mgnify:CR=1 FL=1